jgi:hypothetical protein
MFRPFRQGLSAAEKKWQFAIKIAKIFSFSKVLTSDMIVHCPLPWSGPFDRVSLQRVKSDKMSKIVETF